MKSPTYFIYKWNSKGQQHAGIGRDWNAVLDATLLTSRHHPIGFRNKNPKFEEPYCNAKEGDVLFCYQTAQRAIVGICIVAGKGQNKGEPSLEITPAFKFVKPLPIHEQKKAYPILIESKALSKSPPRSLFELSDTESAAILEICELHSPGLTNELSDALKTFRKSQCETANAPMHP